MSSAATVVAAKQNKYIRTFRVAGATSPDHAVTIESLGLRDSPIFHRLIRKGVIVHIQSNQYYLDETVAVQWKRWRKIRVIGVTALVIAVLVAIKILTNTP